VEVTSVSKFHNGERILVKNLVATLSLKRIADKEIIEFIYSKTGKMISERTLYELRQSIKKDSYEWYTQMRKDQYNYIHEFKERINEITDLQKMTHEIIIRNQNNPSVQLSGIAELHKLNITLSAYLEVLPTIVNSNNNNNAPIPTTSKDSQAEQQPISESEITV
jgi:hypothetical protein